MTTFSNQENNQFLLNAIKQKFVVMSSSNTMTFTIPKQNSNLTQCIPIIGHDEDKGRTSKQFNEFLRRKLQTKQIKPTTNRSNGTPLPKLQVNEFANIEKPILNIPLLQTTNATITAAPTDINSLNIALKRLKCSNYQYDRPQSPTNNAIDLTLALANDGKSNIDTSKPSQTITALTSNANTNVNFEIPFVDCDRIPDPSKSWLNEYCTVDVTNNKFICYMKHPSGVGRILNMQPYKAYQSIAGTKCRDPLTSTVTYKYNVKPFEFNTKSPDDRVLHTFSK